ncbi:gluconokinase [Rhodohalobacter sp. 8-1]|uniref:gluconokinase n=1 Tax=Rhodohalobacter sp. 8-1 TaxID=3131972 RepID=UPI0030EC3720
MVWIIMGVSGSGKTTVGKKLAKRLNIPFYDGDNFHPKENVEKMQSGRPLNDDDRKPWLVTLANKINEWNNNKGAVLACSALKLSYRKLLTSKSDDVQFVYLKGNRETIFNRMKSRSDHYMPAKLLDSQFEALEEPASALTVSVEGNPSEITDRIIKRFLSRE